MKGPGTYLDILTTLAGIAVPEVGLAKTAYNFGKDTYDVFAGNKNVSDYSKGIFSNLLGAGLGQATKGLAGQAVYDTTKNPILATLAEKLGGAVRGKASGYMTDKFFGWLDTDDDPYAGPRGMLSRGLDTLTGTFDPDKPTIGSYRNDPALAVGPYTGKDDTANMLGDPIYDPFGAVGPNAGYDGTNMLGDPNNDPYGAVGPYSGDGGDGGGGDSSGTVICTELHRQGLIPTDFYHAEAKYGYSLPIEIMDGYRVWAMPLVRLMKKSGIFTGIVHFFAQPVLNEMAHRADKAYKTSFKGSVMLSMALPVCLVIGRIKSARNVKYAY
jgi:hypothetical protein